MRARTELERDVERLHSLLPPLTDEQLHWAMCETIENGTDYYGDKHHKDHWLTFATTFNGWQVFRLYYCNTKEYVRGSRYNKKGSVYVWGFECIQKWVSCENPSICVTMGMPKKKVPNANYQRCPFASGEMPMWALGTEQLKPLEMQIKDGELYDKWHCHLYPESVFADKFVWWRGLMERDHRLSVDYFIESYGTYGETLLKMGRIDLFEKWLNHKDTAPSMKVALRNGGLKEGTDIDLWFDHLDLLRKLGLDTHSPKYLCPADLVMEHQRLNDKLARIEAQLQVERNLAIARKNPAILQGIRARGEKWGEFRINENGLTFVPLISIEDYVYEGKKMHHCVGGYYDHFNSLILSARGQNGRIWETIEIRLSQYSIIQSQGVCNKRTDRHQEIMDIVMNHMAEIKSIQENRERAKKLTAVAV